MKLATIIVELSDAQKAIRAGRADEADAIIKAVIVTLGFEAERRENAGGF